MDVLENCKKIYNAVIESNTSEVCREVKNILDRIDLASALDTEQRFDIKVILCELLQNAIQHGNECDQGKKIHVDVSLRKNEDMLEITIKDQGCGFHHAVKADLDITGICECDPMNMSESGRGLFIVQSLCDLMEFNTSGNTVTVRKKLVNASRGIV